MSKDEFPVKSVKLFVENSTGIPLIGFLGGEYGKEINNSIKKDYNNFPVLQQANYEHGLIKGSNPFYVVAVQERLPSNMKVASQADLEKALKWNSLDLRGVYVDSSLALRTEKSPNSYLANNLINQIKKRNFKTRMPAMVPLSELCLVEDSNSSYGLRFELKEDANIIYAPILNEQNGKFSSEDIDLEIGLPKKLGDGNRSFFTGNDGLSGVCLDEDSSMGSNGGYLRYSGSDGRVVVVNAEGVAPEILEAYYNKLKKDKQRFKTQIESKFSKLEILNKEYFERLKDI